MSSPHRPPSDHRRHDPLLLWHRIDPVEAATRQVALGVDGVLGLGAAPTCDVVTVGAEVMPLVIWTGPGDPDVERGATVPLPDGWAPDLSPGDLVALEVGEDRLALRSAGEVPDATQVVAGAREAAAIGAALERLARSDGTMLSVLRDAARDARGQWVVDLVAVGQQLLDDDGEAVRALHRLPLREAIVMAGLRVCACAVAGPDVTAEQLDTFIVGRIVSGLFGGPVVEACGVVYGALGGPWHDGVDEKATVSVLTSLLADPAVVDPVVDHLRAVGGDAVGEAEWRMRPVRRADRRAPGPTWVHAALLLRQSRPRDAQAALEDLVARLDDRAAEEWSPLVECAARLRAISGDVDGASALVRRVAPVGHLARLERWIPAPPRVPRNAPCPCGSGAKAKTCCLLHPTPQPLGQRVGLLWDKLTDWAIVEQVDVRIAVSEAAVSCGPRADPADLDAAFAAQLFEGGTLGTVLEEIGALLPPDERDLASSWRLARHALWSVGPPTAGGVVWTDMGTGARATVIGMLDDHPDLEPPPVGAPVLAVLLPAPVGHLVVGAGQRVAPGDVALVLDLVRWGLDASSLRLLGHAIRRAGPDGLSGDRPLG